ncbi:YIP1 family protein [Desulfosediminicola flagellatus]|uniref:YIP1 family protein n=1 Tax=Desulfosediminicola flagellatus TaxID=2569541 RepID=UPI0010AC5AC4|nr:YIP1 family protein [Desulfosediminicola flagellatus]
MNYIEYFKGSLFGEENIFHLANEGKVRKFVILNIIILGILFGMSDLAGLVKETPGLPLTGKFVFITPFLFSLSGIFTMVIAIVGCTLVYWAAAKAFGGNGTFSLTLDLIGLSAIPFWILAPVLNYTIRFQPDHLTSPQFILPTLLAFWWSCWLLRQSLIGGQGLSPGRATCVVLSVWVFCISSVYVFLP